MQLEGDVPVKLRVSEYKIEVDDCPCIIIDQGEPQSGEFHAEVALVWGNDETARKLANLFVTSPELLEALKAAVSIIGHPEDVMSKHFEQVIAKAEGRE